MVTQGAGVYLHIPDESPKRVLHPGTAVRLENDVCTIELDETSVPVEPGANVFVYFETRGQFMQQPGHVEAVMENGRKVVVGLELKGTPVSAEARQCYRVSAVTSRLSVRLADGTPCPLLDVSLTGFSMLCATGLPLASIVEVAIRFEDIEYTGQASVQSTLRLDDGRIRCGLHAIDDRQSGGTLQRGLREMTMRIQQLQLRRRRGRALSGTARGRARLG